MHSKSLIGLEYVHCIYLCVCCGGVVGGLSVLMAIHISKAVRSGRHQILTIIGGVTENHSAAQIPRHGVHYCGDLIG